MLRRFRRTKNWGFVVLAIWLILTGVLPLLRISFPGMETLLGVLAIVAGILILVNR